MSRGLKIIYIPEKNNRVGNKSTETRHRQRSGVHPWSIRTDLGRHGAKENSGDAEPDRGRLSEKSNIPQRESRIRLRSCRGVRSTLVSQGILRQSDELSGEPPAISFKNYFCGARSLMLWFAFRFFNFTDIHNLKLYMWLILNGLGCVVQWKNPAIFSLDFFIMYLFFGSYKSYNIGALVWTTCNIYVSAVIFMKSCVL